MLNRSGSFITITGLLCTLCVMPSFAASDASKPIEPTNIVLSTNQQAPFEQDLNIPECPVGTLRIEVDARDEDVLGVLKSFISGVNSRLSTLKDSLPANDPRMTMIMSVATELPNAVKNIHHIHGVIYSLEGMSSSGKDLIGAYDKAFITENGHRIAYANMDTNRFEMIGFSKSGGFAIAFQAPGMIAVLRADGYPDASVIGSVSTMAAMWMVPHSTGYSSGYSTNAPIINSPVHK